VQPLATSKALFIHRNTLEYRLNRISELTGLDLGNLTTGCCCMWRCNWMNSGMKAKGNLGCLFVCALSSGEGRGEGIRMRHSRIIYCASVFPDRLQFR
jgi:hypothetical protein